MKKNNKPISPLSNSEPPIDPEIFPLVDAINQDNDFATLGSCCGHEEKPANVDFAVRGLKGLRRLTVILNSIQNALDDEGIRMDLTIIWKDDCATACDWEQQPTWISMSLAIEKLLEAGPSKILLKKIADEFSSASINVKGR